MHKIIFAFDSLKFDTALFIPKAGLLERYKTLKGAEHSIRSAIKKNRRDKTVKPVVKEFEDGVRIWKKPINA